VQIDRLVRAIRDKGNPTALGLDTRVEYLPPGFAASHAGKSPAGAVYEFNSALLEALRDIIPCVKIQSAYYEMLGTDGLACLSDTIARARAFGYVVIVDAKRGDIGATASAYSAAYLREGSPFRADFLTVNPYFGTDGMAPFLSDCHASGSGLFVLVKTSNPSGREFQDLITDDGRPLYERVGERVAEWGIGATGAEGYSSVGAVVGATYPEQGAALRRQMPHTFFLLPGYGAQGATAEGLAACFDANGEGAVVAASRSLICAYKKTGGGDFARAAREEAIRMKDEISGALGRKR
jgi:orotidine-5'-phosphate decarboxylase